VRLFLDANVLFSAAYSPQGRSRALFELTGIGLCALLSSPHAVEEARRNLALKSAIGNEELAALLDRIELVPEPGPRLVSWATEQGLPPNDAPILAAAVAVEADALVTGDRTHFVHLFGGTFGNAEILPLSESIEFVLAGRRG
jgi:predicted nucleic acid-binding protein